MKGVCSAPVASALPYRSLGVWATKRGESVVKLAPSAYCSCTLRVPRSCLALAIPPEIENRLTDAEASLCSVSDSLPAPPEECRDRNAKKKCTFGVR